MNNLDNLKEITILYAEDSSVMRRQTTEHLSRYVKKIITAKDGKEGLDKFLSLKDEIDIILSDIVMPNMTGLEMVREIKKESANIPCVMATSLIDTNTFVEVIDLNVAGYAIKPINYEQLLSTLSAVAITVKNKKQLEQKEREAKQYLDTMNDVAIVTKTDLKGNITYANKLFCEVSQYTPKELVGKPHNIVRHSDVDKKIFEELWNTIQDSKVWKGTVKNKAKDGSSYFVKSTVMPLFDTNGKISEYISMRILVTDEENTKREFKKGVVQAISKNRQSEQELKLETLKLNNEIDKLKKTINTLETSNSLMQDKVQHIIKQAVHKKDKYKAIEIQNNDKKD